MIVAYWLPMLFCVLVLLGGINAAAGGHIRLTYSQAAVIFIFAIVPLANWILSAFMFIIVFITIYNAGSKQIEFKNDKDEKQKTERDSEK